MFIGSFVLRVYRSIGSLEAPALEAAAKDCEEHEPAADDEQDDGDEADALPPPRRARRP